MHFYYQKTWRNQLHVDMEKITFSYFREMLPEALSFHAEHSHACQELYEVPGGVQVDGSPPAPVYLVELFVIDELEEFRRGMELVGRADEKGQSDNFWVVLRIFERYLTIHFEKPDFPHL